MKERQIKRMPVTRWRGHVTELGKSGDGASTTADWNKGTVTALAPRREQIDSIRQGSLALVRIATDVTYGLCVVSGEARTGVERAVWSDGVGVVTVEFAGTHSDGVNSSKSTLSRLIPKERYVFVGQPARATNRARTSGTATVSGRAARTVLWPVTHARSADSNWVAHGRRSGRADYRLERDLSNAAGEVLFAKEVK